jgi:hypothetical protein
MNPDTGAIAQFENEADAKLAGFTVALSGKTAEELAMMPRVERKAWLKHQERKLKELRGRLPV